MTDLPVMYISSPYSKGDQAINTKFQCSVFNRLMDDKIVLPFTPLWSHFQHLMYPRPYQDWMDYDLAILKRFDGCIRLNASVPEIGYLIEESTGADMEVAAFKALNKPVFYSIEECYDWINKQK